MLNQFSLRMKLILSTALSFLTIVALTGGGHYMLDRLIGTVDSLRGTAQMIHTHADADMMHDAIRADVLLAMFLRREG